MSLSSCRSLSHLLPARPPSKARPHLRIPGLLVCTILAWLIALPILCRADGITTLHTFTTPVFDPSFNIYKNVDGWGPNNLMSGSDGGFYGTTYSGGTNGTGVIFKLTADGSLSVLHTFAAYNSNGSPYSPNSDGAQPIAGLIQASDGDFYGVTVYGGANGTGTIFKITADGQFYKLHDFLAIKSDGSNVHGAFPFGGLIQGSDGALYGTTFSGGKYGSGVVFRFNITKPHNFTVLYRFKALDEFGTNVDGANPAAALLQGSDGALYGSTFDGGANTTGTLFRLTTNGTFTLLHTFQIFNNSSANADGANPMAPLIQASDGDLYGTAPFGGRLGNGVVFKITPAGVFTTLHSFSATDGLIENRDGEIPSGPLMQSDDGTLYGTTTLGGARGSGTIFTITAEGRLTTLYDFGLKDANLQNQDGIDPDSLVQGSDGYIYGATYAGGTGRSGTLFRLGPVITSVAPISIAADTAFTLTITGSGFYAGDKVYWNDHALPTTVVSSTQLTAAVSKKINGLQSSYPASVTISVVAKSGFTVSAAISVTEPHPQLTQLAPNTLPAGHPQTRLTVEGADFAPGAVVDWNDMALATTFVSSHRLVATIPADLLTTPGTAQVSVANPGSGGASSSLPFTITP